jgi:hypothetical protein
VRRWVTAVIVLVVASACGGGIADPAATSTTVIETTTTTSVATTTTQMVEPTTPPRPVWEGFAATAEAPSTLAAMAHDEIDIYTSKDDLEPAMTIDAQTILGTVTVLGVVNGPVDGWVEVMLPVRPNGSTGWARAQDFDFYVVDSEIVVDLGDRRLRYLVDGVEVLTTEIGIGSKYNQTPVGEYFVTDSVTLANPNSPWGPHALGLSARSDTITEFNGGDGIIGIHGTNNPSSIGGNISLGCVRLPNDMIAALHALVPIGTRVQVRA